MVGCIGLVADMIGSDHFLKGHGSVIFLSSLSENSPFVISNGVQRSEKSSGSAGYGLRACLGFPLSRKASAIH